MLWAQNIKRSIKIEFLNFKEFSKHQIVLRKIIVMVFGHTRVLVAELFYLMETIFYFQQENLETDPLRKTSIVILVK